jgi:kynurenine formamidase
MKATINNIQIDLSKPIDISIPLTNNDQNPIAWYQNAPEIEPVTMGDWIGKVSEGKSSTNFNNIFFNPHAHGTHTECLGHITREFTAELISVEPKSVGEDLIISKAQIEIALGTTTPQAIIIRTLPNPESKKHLNYSNTNPPYLEEAAAIFIREKEIQHLLIDLPSVDREHDEGKLLAHKAFWNVKDINQANDDARFNCTITEMIYVDDSVKDGSYILNLQFASFENDASPSKPVLYSLE